MLEIVRHRPDDKLLQLLARLPTCSPRIKLQIVVDDSLVGDVEAFLQDLARRRGQPKEEFVLVALAGGSVRLLVSMPAGTAAPEDLAELYCLAETEQQIESIIPFDSLDTFSQQIWRIIACNHPPSIRDNGLRPVVAWSEMTDTETSRLRQTLVEYFSEEELRTLCDDLDVDYESLPSVGKADKARELIAYFQRRRRLSQLVEISVRRAHNKHRSERYNSWDQPQFQSGEGLEMTADTYKVFISHASEDKDRFVLDFARRLREHGVDAWVDVWEMLPGDSLVDKIFDEGIKNARAMIIILSTNSIDKPWVREELNAGFLKRLSGKCKVIPVVIDECGVPEALQSTVWQRISDLTDYEEEFLRVLDSIYGRTRKPPLGAPAAQLRRQRLRDDLDAGRVPMLDYADAQQDLEGLILDKDELPLWRLQALTHYLTLETKSATVLEKLLTDPDPQVRLTVFRGLHKDPRRDLLQLFDVLKVKRILNDPDEDVAVASTRLACDLVGSGIVPAEVMTTVNRHSYWLIRRIAIQCIINSGDPRTLDLLYEFRTTSYHVSQRLIRDYINTHYDSFEDDQKNLAIDLLRNLMIAKRASLISKSKTEKLIEMLLQR